MLLLFPTLHVTASLVLSYWAALLWFCLPPCSVTQGSQKWPCAWVTSLLMPTSVLCSQSKSASSSPSMVPETFISCGKWHRKASRRAAPNVCRGNPWDLSSRGDGWVASSCAFRRYVPPEPGPSFSLAAGSPEFQMSHSFLISWVCHMSQAANPQRTWTRLFFLDSLLYCHNYSAVYNLSKCHHRNIWLGCYLCISVTVCVLFRAQRQAAWLQVPVPPPAVLVSLSQFLTPPMLSSIHH